MIPIKSYTKSSTCSGSHLDEMRSYGLDEREQITRFVEVVDEQGDGWDWYRVVR